MTSRSPMQGANGLLRRFARDRRGANAIEFAILAMPFVMLMLFTLQIGIYFATKVCLDAGVLHSAESLQGQFSSGAPPQLPSAGSLKTQVASVSNLVVNGSSLAVEVQPLANLAASSMPVVDGVTNYGAPNVVLAIRARYAPILFMPGFTSNTISASALVRRQGF